jgi:hypothetical protein
MQQQQAHQQRSPVTASAVTLTRAAKGVMLRGGSCINKKSKHIKSSY